MTFAASAVRNAIKVGVSCKLTIRISCIYFFYRKIYLFLSWYAGWYIWMKPEKVSAKYALRTKNCTNAQRHRDIMGSWHAPEVPARLPCRPFGENQMGNIHYHQWPSMEIWQLRLQMSSGLFTYPSSSDCHMAQLKAAPTSLFVPRVRGWPYGHLRHPLLILLSFSGVAA